MSQYKVRVRAKGQVTIPIEIRRKLNLKKGDRVTFLDTKEGVMILPVEAVASQALERIGRALQEQGLELEELKERGREIRGEILESEHHIPDTSGRY